MDGCKTRYPYFSQPVVVGEEDVEEVEDGGWDGKKMKKRGGF